MNIYCVVVTYNRLALLKECLQAVAGQTRRPDRIIVVDNCSTDGTTEYLRDNAAELGLHVVHMDRNVGGSGGFSCGLKESVLEGADCTWLMDDDTIPAPDQLERLAAVAEEKENVGFVYGRVNWTDGQAHQMNRPGFGKHTPQPAAEVQPCHTASFVSLLVTTQAVLKVGLPIKEFFIWCDDIEYTLRISDAGFRSYYVPAAVALHKSVSNYFPSVDKAPAHMASRFYYQMRNTTYMKHTHVKFYPLLWISTLNKLRVMKRRIKRRNDGTEAEFLKAVKRGCRDGLHFNPKIEYINPKHIRRATLR